MTAGTDLIAEERDRQIIDLGYDIDHDKTHDSDDLAFAAVCYAAPIPVYLTRTLDRPFEEEGRGRGGLVQWIEPWPNDWPRKDRATNREERIRELVKAGALIAAEIDKLLEQ